MQDYQNFLISELERRKKMNPNFSLRAFARVLTMSPSHLSLLMNGKKNLSRKQLTKVADKLGLSPLQAQRLLGSSLRTGPVEATEGTQRLLRDDEFRLISDWYHFAILSLGSLKENRANGKWIADQLGISQIQALDAFERLKRLGYIEIRGAGFRQSSKPLTTTTDVPSAAIRQYHKQNLDLAKEKLEKVPLEKRCYSAITMAVNPRQLMKAKKIIEEFKALICEELEQGPPQDIYTLSVQLFPITKTGEVL